MYTFKKQPDGSFHVLSENGTLITQTATDIAAEVYVTAFNNAPPVVNTRQDRRATPRTGNPGRRKSDRMQAAYA